MLITVTPNPAVDRTVILSGFREGCLNRVLSARSDPGGKGINVARSARIFEMQTAAGGFLSGNSGEAIASVLRDEGIADLFVRTKGETRTNIKMIDSLSHLQTEINEAGRPVTAEEISDLEERICGEIRPGDCVAICGSLPPDVSPEIFRRWTERFREAGARVLLDADGERLASGIAGRPYFVKPNRKELELFSDRPFWNLDDIRRAAVEIFDRGVAYVLVSLGREGALLVSEEGTFFSPSQSVEVQSEVGAGDAMVAAAAFAIDRGLSSQELLRTASGAAAAAVSREGTGPASRAKTDRLVASAVVKQMT